jgi:hypothetical protein
MCYAIISRKGEKNQIFNQTQIDDEGVKDLLY